MVTLNFMALLSLVIYVIGYKKKGGNTVVFIGGGYGHKKKSSKYLKDPPYFIGKPKWSLY